jgi:hypothetical protein
MTRDELIEQYRLMAEMGTQFHGRTILRYEAHLMKLFAKHRIKTVLDYGSGHGQAWSGGLDRRLGVTSVRRFDPAFEQFSTKPTQHEAFDAVVCIDVLEHLLAVDAVSAIDDLFRHARKLVFATVCCRPAKKCFPDGTNMHVTVKPESWWRLLFNNVPKANGCSFVLLQTP